MKNINYNTFINSLIDHIKSNSIILAISLLFISIFLFFSLNVQQYLPNFYDPLKPIINILIMLLPSLIVLSNSNDTFYSKDSRDVFFNSNYHLRQLRCLLIPYVFSFFTRLDSFISSIARNAHSWTLVFLLLISVPELNDITHFFNISNFFYFLLLIVLSLIVFFNVLQEKKNPSLSPFFELILYVGVLIAFLVSFMYLLFFLSMPINKTEQSILQDYNYILLYEDDHFINSASILHEDKYVPRFKYLVFTAKIKMFEN